MKLIKKIGAVCAAAVLTLSMGMCTFAAGSSTVETTTSTPGIYVEAQTDSARVEEAQAVTTLNGQNVTLAEVIEVRAEDGVTFPVKITFTVPGIKAGDTVICRHYVDGAWKDEPCTVNADGTVTVTFEKLSPVAFYKVAGATTKATSTTATGTTTKVASTTSPKTGSTPVATVATLALVMFAAGAVVTAKKRA